MASPSIETAGLPPELIPPMAVLGGAGGRWESPLHVMEGAMARLSGPPAALSGMPPRAAVTLRAAEGMLAEVGRVFGVAPPTTPNTWTASADGCRVAIWLGPDEWLLVGPDGLAPGLDAAIREARTNDPRLAVTDTSHNYTTLVLAGPRARLVLSKGCALDLDPRGPLKPGTCAQTTVGRSRALLRFIVEGPGGSGPGGSGPGGSGPGGSDAIELWVRNSFARYMAAWLLDSMTGVVHEPADF